MTKNKKHKWKYQINIKKKILVLLVLGVSLFVGLGYALINSSLGMNGTLEVGKYLPVYWDNVVLNNGGISGNAAPSISETTASFKILLSAPGDYYEFTVDTNNRSGSHMMITSISNKVGINEIDSANIPSYLKYTVTYSDDEDIGLKQYLRAGTSQNPQKDTYKVRVEIKSTLTPEEEQALYADGGSYTREFSFTVTYGTPDSEAYDRATPVDFTTESWKYIGKAYAKGHPSKTLISAMENGTLKEVELDMDHDGTPETTAHVRIANLSKPAECSQPGFSQTACGFVIEFADIIDTHRVNPNTNVITNGDGNKGGWEYSDIRAYLNGGKYLEGTPNEINYSQTGLIYALPDELEYNIISTTVVSGHGPNDGSNFTTSDKLYLLDPTEIVGTSFNDGYNTAITCERQLDYYQKMGVTPTNYSAAEKNDIVPNHYPWYWYRSAYSRWAANFYSNDAGNVNVASSEDSGGVSPAFRIAE